ncbi:unnamed protein product [Candidula unifasciata]|uniref:Serine/threonine-protein phosphatase 4 regulatory subunit 2 n=1 Tax=Candidula unifasciata TaxID=100452 RepID=A0A8S3ZM81_9EUPU|nr:unnamed protein product [Candidula unifasciata]
MFFSLFLVAGQQINNDFCLDPRLQINNEFLSSYSRNPCPEIPAVLEQYLNGIAANGETLYHWPLLKPLLFAKMEQVIGELQKGLSSEVIPERPNVENVPFDVMHARIVEAFHKFNGTPFTIQRLCELLMDPKRHYKRSDKFLRGLEKNVLVVSTVDPFGRNVVSEVGNKHLVNGLDTVGSPFFPRDSSITSNLPPVPGWVTSAPSVTSPHSVAPTAVADQKQSQPSSHDSAVTTSVVSGVVTSLYGEPPQATQAEEVVEETVVTMDTSESSVADCRETGSEDGMGREDSNTSSSSSSSSEELSANDTSDNSPGVPAADTDTSHTSPWVSVLAEGEDKVHVTSSVAAGVDDQSAGVTNVDSSDECNRSASKMSPQQAVGVGGTYSILSSSGVNSSSESSEKSSSCVDRSNSLESESSEKSSSHGDDSSSLENELIAKSSLRVDESSSLKSESSKKSSFHVDDTNSPDRSNSLESESSEKSSSDVDGSSLQLPMDTSYSQEPQAKRRKLSHEMSHVHDSPKTSSDFPVSSNTLGDVVASSDFPVSTNILGDVVASSDFPVSTNTLGDVVASSDFPVSSSTSGDVIVPSAFPASSSTSGDVTVPSAFPASSSTSGDVDMSLDSDPVSTTESNMTSELNPADLLCVQDTDVHGGLVDSELGVHPEVHEPGSEGPECVASPPSQEASSSDSQGFDATVESQNIVDTEATNVEGSAKLDGFDQAGEFRKTEEPEKEEEISEGNLVDPQS